jgi:hypothetical protein
MTVQKALVILTLVLAVAVPVRAAFVTFAPESLAVISGKWSASGHADRESLSFTYWDDAEPPVIPIGCAKCHSNYAFLDFLGEIGDTPGVVDREPLIGSVVSCTTCHNPTAHRMTQVTFPSGAEITALGAEATCLICHQGTRAGADVDEAIAGLEDDAVSEDLSFINVHYAIAASTQWGGEARGGYEYAGRSYVGFYDHVSGYSTCVECHDPHSLQVNPQDCSPCHFGVVDQADLVNIRVDRTDYDGDGDTEKGIAAEIATLQETLLQALQEYAAEIVGEPIFYSPISFPYFFAFGPDEEPGPGDLHFGNRYTSWTPRLLRAAYNYQFSRKDAGNYTHNPRYVLQILYDSIEDLGERVEVDLAPMTRP